MAWVVRGCDTRARALNCADLAPLPTCFFQKNTCRMRQIPKLLTSFQPRSSG